MARRGAGPFPIPDGFLTLPEAHLRFIGVQPREGSSRQWAEKGFSLWTEVYSALLMDELVSYAFIRGVGFGSLSVQFWTNAKRTQGPPRLVDHGWGDQLEPLVKEADLPKIAAMWARNPFNDSPSEAKEFEADPPSSQSEESTEAAAATEGEDGAEERATFKPEPESVHPDDCVLGGSLAPAQTSRPRRQTAGASIANLIAKHFPNGVPKATSNGDVMAAIRDDLGPSLRATSKRTFEREIGKARQS